MASLFKVNLTLRGSVIGLTLAFNRKLTLRSFSSISSLTCGASDVQQFVLRGESEVSCWVTCAIGYMCHEQQPLKQYMSAVHLPARVKARLTIKYYPHTDTEATRVKAIACQLDMVMPLIRPPLVCLSGGSRMCFGGFPPPLVDINIMH